MKLSFYKTSSIEDSAMITFEVKNMPCGHCVSTITQAVKAQDPGAKLQVDLATHRIDIESSGIDAAQWIDVFHEAGYTAVGIPAGAQAATSGIATARSGCGCG
jgi:copper chaperone